MITIIKAYELPASDPSGTKKFRFDFKISRLKELPERPLDLFQGDLVEEFARAGHELVVFGIVPRNPANPDRIMTVCLRSRASLNDLSSLLCSYDRSLRLEKKIDNSPLFHDTLPHLISLSKESMSSTSRSRLIRHQRERVRAITRLLTGPCVYDYYERIDFASSQDLALKKLGFLFADCEEKGEREPPA